MRNAAPVAALMPVQNLDLARDPKVNADPKAIADLKPEAKIDPVAVPIAMPRSPQKAHVAGPDPVVLVAVVSAPADSVAVLAARSAEVLAQVAPVEVSAPAVAVLATRLVADEAKAADRGLNQKRSQISPRTRKTRTCKSSSENRIARSR